MQITTSFHPHTSWLTGTHRRWASLGIRAKILISLTLMMALSTVGSVGVFVVTTNATRVQLQDQQLGSDLERATQALRTRENELRTAAQLLANDPELQAAVQREQAGVLDIDRRALPIRDRFQLDQVVVVGPGGGVRANIVARSALSALSFEVSALAEHASTGAGLGLIHSQPPLLAAYSPIKGGGAVIVALALPDELTRMRQTLDLPSQVDLRAGQVLLASSMNSVERQHSTERMRQQPLDLGAQPLTLLVRLENPEIDSIIAAGRNAMLVSVLTTFVLLLLLGSRFAYTLSQPIRRLTNVADAVAAGEWNRRAALSFNDEIGRLGRAFDHAAQTITTLLSQRDHEASQRQAILQSIADGVLAVDAQEQLLLVNPAAQRLLGWKNPPLGQRIGTLFALDEASRDEGRLVLGQLLREVLQGAPSAERQTLLGGRDLRLSCATVRGKDGRALGAVAVLQDVSDVVAADRAKTQFIATASHELRTPLAGLKGWLDLLYLQGLENLSDDQRYGLGIVRRQSELLATLVNDLLEVARLEQGQSESRRQVLDPATVVSDVLAAFEAQIAAAGHHLSVEVDEHLPSVLINGSHLRRMLANLLSNAIKYTPEGGAIWVRAFAHDEQVYLEVEDNGVGIAAADQERIFNRFFRSENPLSVKAGGTGLGLSIARSMAELHGGQISFSSIEGQGSRFWLELPSAVLELAAGKTAMC